ncbi:MAG: hypothetical protein NW214_01790 [Pseudanabaenaceae cyanobacterium bins.39]|nr:hypothetical protein [Pseudanabaenaceae cyanobacterium bins.39]
MVNRNSNNQPKSVVKQTQNNVVNIAAKKNEDISANDEEKPSIFKKFTTVLEYILQDITRLEVNTIIVSDIPVDNFDARNFYEDLMFLTPDGLKVVRKSLKKWDDYIQANQANKEWCENEREQHSRISSRCDKAEQSLIGVASFTGQQQERQQLYQELTDQVLKLNFLKDHRGRIKPDASSIRFLRQLWEYQQNVLSGDRIYAQTRLELDGDLTNRFLEDLLLPSHRKLDTSTAKTILDIHFGAVRNAEEQWTGLIQSCVDLIGKLASKSK